MTDNTLPFTVAKELYRLHLQSELVQGGITPNEAVATVDKLTCTELQSAIDKLKKEHLVC